MFSCRFPVQLVFLLCCIFLCSIYVVASWVLVWTVRWRLKRWPVVIAETRDVQICEWTRLFILVSRVQIRASSKQDWNRAECELCRQQIFDNEYKEFPQGINHVMIVLVESSIWWSGSKNKCPLLLNKNLLIYSKYDRQPLVFSIFLSAHGYCIGLLRIFMNRLKFWYFLMMWNADFARGAALVMCSFDLSNL